MTTKLLAIILTLYATGCATSGQEPFLSEDDFSASDTAALSEEEVNKLIFKVIAQLGVPQNFLKTTSQGGLVAATGGGMTSELTCEEGVDIFTKTRSSDTMAIYLDYDAQACFDKALASASAVQREKMRTIMDIKQMRTRYFTQTICDLKTKEETNRLSATKFLIDGGAQVCQGEDSSEVLMNYEVAIDARVMGQPVQTSAKLLIAREFTKGCQLNVDKSKMLNTNGCRIMMRLSSPAGKAFVMSIQSRAVKGSLDLPYFSEGHYDVSINEWTGKVSFAADKNPEWKLQREDQLASGTFDGRGIITH